MSIATYEQRLQALEAAVADLRSRQSNGSNQSLGELPPDTELPLIPCVPPKNVVHLQGRLTSVEPPPQHLGLSHSEWMALNLQQVDE